MNLVRVRVLQVFHGTLVLWLGLSAQYGDSGLLLHVIWQFSGSTAIVPMTGLLEKSPGVHGLNPRTKEGEKGNR